MSSRGNRLALDWRDGMQEGKDEFVKERETGRECRKGRIRREGGRESVRRI